MMRRWSEGRGLVPVCRLVDQCVDWFDVWGREGWKKFWKASSSQQHVQGRNMQILLSSAT